MSRIKWPLLNILTMTKAVCMYSVKIFVKDDIQFILYLFWIFEYQKLNRHVCLLFECEVRNDSKSHEPQHLWHVD
jgi:hypothetical protein